MQTQKNNIEVFSHNYNAIGDYREVILLTQGMVIYKILAVVKLNDDENLPITADMQGETSKTKYGDITMKIGYDTIATLPIYILNKWVNITKSGIILNSSTLVNKPINVIYSFKDNILSKYPDKKISTITTKIYVFYE
ncbi:MAG: hypothetical protein SNJ71_00295 [Bacteroidales bacterium]